MYRHALNAPYNLLTPHGRAQSHAYSAQGAALAEAVEVAIEEAQEEFANELAGIIQEAMKHIATDKSADEDLEDSLQVFYQELGVRDKAVFKPLLDAYIAERDFRTKNFDMLLALVTKIQERFKGEPT